MKLNHYLKKNKITYAQFADQISVSTAAVCRYVKEKRIPQPDVMRRISKATKYIVNANDFYEK